MLVLVRVEVEGMAVLLVLVRVEVEGMAVLLVLVRVEVGGMAVLLILKSAPILRLYVAKHHRSPCSRYLTYMKTSSHIALYSNKLYIVKTSITYNLVL